MKVQNKTGFFSQHSILEQNLPCKHSTSVFAACAATALAGLYACRGALSSHLMNRHVGYYGVALTGAALLLSYVGYRCFKGKNSKPFHQELPPFPSIGYQQPFSLEASQTEKFDSKCPSPQLEPAQTEKTQSSCTIPQEWKLCCEPEKLQDALSKYAEDHPQSTSIRLIIHFTKSGEIPLIKKGTWTQSVKHLELKGGPGLLILFSDLNQFRVLSNISSLTILDVFKTPEPMLALRHFPKLEFLKLSFMSRERHCNWQGFAHDNLRSLKIRGENTLPPLKNLPGLEKFNQNIPQGRADSYLAEIAKLSFLKILKLNGDNKFDPTSIARLRNQPLVALSLGNLSDRLERVLEKVLELRHLRYLKLDLSFLTWKEIPRIRSVFEILNDSSLEILECEIDQYQGRNFSAAINSLLVDLTFKYIIVTKGSFCTDPLDGLIEGQLGERKNGPGLVVRNDYRKPPLPHDCQMALDRIFNSTGVGSRTLLMEETRP